MVDAGLLEEVERLVANGAGASLTSGQAIGYAEFIEHLAGRLGLDEAIAATARRTRALARRRGPTPFPGACC